MPAVSTRSTGEDVAQRESAVAEFYQRLGITPGEYPTPRQVPRIRRGLGEYLKKSPRLTNRLPVVLCWLLIPEVETALLEGRDPAAAPPKSFQEWRNYRGIGPHAITRFIRPLGLLTEPAEPHGPEEFSGLSSKAQRLLAQVHGFRTQAAVVRAVLQGSSLYAPGYGPKTLTEIFGWLALPNSTAGLYRQATRLRARLAQYQETAGTDAARKLGAALSPLAADIGKLRRGTTLALPPAQGVRAASRPPRTKRQQAGA